MIITKPDFYDKFKCRADRCSDSCCIGWEIDIDAETLEKYKIESGNLSEKLKAFTDEKNSCFRLTKDDRCPFLNENNLCTLILCKGDDFLCEICREHPRFYEWYGNYTDQGLGLCCEEAASLLFASSEKLGFIVSENGESVKCDDDDEFIEYVRRVRKTAIETAEDRSLDLKDRIQKVFSYVSKIQPSNFDLQKINENDFYDALIYAAETTEPYDENFTRLVSKLKENKHDIINVQSTFLNYMSLRKNDYEKLFSYLLYRWLIKAFADGDFFGRLNFCLGVTAIAYYTDILCFLENGEYTACDRINNVKYLSKQFEYSDINPGLFSSKLCEKLADAVK